ncbi:PGAP1-domain-containing protein [Neolentinus lepideus HHB14362 ss-1]|uniref:GPI inositol-deacylase n=1 Tax=Neolentinus lepideus HHB14362 ss-1 TaxID=1314782 RepID=A0A165S1M7_9AGAM|nr:PGAP1-domain-containing protein [Neolentinus lepideus HHB14362 ss-1]
MTRLVSFLGLLSVALTWVFYKAASETSSVLCPQGCRMSWMSPSYVLQDKFDKSWTRLSRRYSLWLYREVGWDSHELQGAPVLFIPGNAGSSHQVRSIASSGTRQYFASPSVTSPDFLARRVKPLDFFALEFNEDLSAFHGPTLMAQTSYAHAAITYILSLYPRNTSIIVLGHSMGGVVSTSLLPDPRISAIITMSTPHTLPPARFDRRIEDIYMKNTDVLENDFTPILSLCGGAIDMQIPSEACILPLGKGEDVYRRTVFTTALEGAWTGVGHLAMVWCHQVRWRVARAALEIAALTSTNSLEKGNVLDRWLPGGNERHPAYTGDMNDSFVLENIQEYEALPDGMKLILRNPTGSHTYLLPISVPSQNSKLFTIYLSGGTLLPYGKRVHQLPSRMGASVHICAPSSYIIPEIRCRPLQPTTLNVIPNPRLSQLFPLPDEGTDESEGLVMLSAELPTTDENVSGYVAVRLEGAEGNGWIVAGVEDQQKIVNKASWTAPFTGPVPVAVRGGLTQEIFFPNLVSNALVVYKLIPVFSSDPGACSASLLPPLLSHASSASETSYHPLALPPSSHQILLHTHAAAPYISTFVPSADLPSEAVSDHGLRLRIFSSNEHQPCKIDALTIHVDWWATIGRWAARYWTACVIWSVAIAAILMWSAITQIEETESVTSPTLTLHTYARGTLPILLPVVFVAAIVPWPTEFYLGLGWHSLATGLIGGCIAVLLVMTSSGLVAVTWFMLICGMAVMRRLTMIFGRPREDTSVRRNTILSISLVFVLIFFFVPWQVAFLGNWFIFLWVCGTKSLEISGASSPRVEAVPLVHRAGTMASNTCSRNDDDNVTDSSRARAIVQSTHNFYLHFLLLKTLLLPLVAPVLAVWVRTLYTAGLTTPFDGDHNFLFVAPWLILVDYTSWASGGDFLARGPYEGLSMRWLFAIQATAALFLGPRGTFRIIDVAAICLAFVVVFRIGPRYWGNKYLPPRIRTR